MYGSFAAEMAVYTTSGVASPNLFCCMQLFTELFCTDTVVIHKFRIIMKLLLFACCIVAIHAA